MIWWKEWLALRILAVRKHTQLKLKRLLRKYWYEYLGSWYIRSTLNKRFLNWSKIFWSKNKAVTGKTPFIMVGLLVHQSFEEGFCFPESLFQSYTVQNIRKFPVIVTWKHADTSNLRLFWSSRVLFLKEPTLFLLILKDPPRQSVFLC